MELLLSVGIIALIFILALIVVYALNKINEPPPLYSHYKGGLYYYLGNAKHSETLEQLVVYKSATSGELWVRPYLMFHEEINIDGKLVKRFKLISD